MGNGLCFRGFEPMRIRLILVIMFVVFAAGVLFSVIMINNKNIAEVDLVAINDVVKTVEENWGQINNEETFQNLSNQQPLTVIDRWENVIYQTSDNPFHHINDAIKNRDTLIDLKKNNEIVGKLIIHNNEQQIVDQMKSELVTSISLIFGLLMLISILYISYIYRTLLKPFQQLQSFATNVARGHLERIHR